MLVSAVLLSVSPPYGAADAGPTRVLIGFDPANAAAVQGLVHAAGGRIVFQYGIVSALAVDMPSRALAAVSSSRFVSYVEADEARHLVSHILPNELWTGTPEILPWGVEKIGADDVWDKNHDLRVDRGAVAGQGVRVAVLDTGIDRNHPDLKANLVPLSDYCRDICDFVDGDRDPSDPPGPFQGHGSLTSGNIVAVDNSVGVIGVAPLAKVMMYRVCDSVEGECSTSAIVAGIQEAVEDRARIISMSFGGLTTTQTERDAITAAFKAGLLLVASSGNGGGPPVNFPAALPEVIAVGATDRTDTIASFSSFGPDQELVAPGVDVPSTTVRGIGREALFSVVSGVSPIGGRQTNPLEFSALGTVTNVQMRYVGLGTVLEVEAECTAAEPCTGQLALIKRGVITFQEKVANAAAAGFVGAVIFNNVPGNFFGTLSEPSAIPAGSISLEDGDPIRVAIETGALVFGSLAVVALDYESASGTSFSAPHVSGVGALVWSKNPRLTNEEVRTILQTTAVDLGTPGYDFVYGFGRVDAAAAVAATPAR